MFVRTKIMCVRLLKGAEPTDLPGAL